MHLSMVASSALRPTASSVVIEYTCLLAHSLNLLSVKSISFVLSIPTSTFFSGRSLHVGLLLGSCSRLLLLGHDHVATCVFDELQ